MYASSLSLQKLFHVLSDHVRLFIITSEAYFFAICKEILQKELDGHESAITYNCRQIKSAEKTYSVHDKKLLATKYSLVKFRVHLHGSKLFVIFSSHANH